MVHPHRLTLRFLREHGVATPSTHTGRRVVVTVRHSDILVSRTYDARMELGRRQLEDALATLGDVLARRGLDYEVVLVGGGSLLLCGIIARPTKDADLLGMRLESGDIVRVDVLPAPLVRAVRDVGQAAGLAADWLNLGPASLLDLGLPPGFTDRLSRIAFGSLVVWFAGTYDLICFKLYAAADHWPSRDRHLDDLRALRPTREQVLEAARWARTHDASPGFLLLLRAVLREMGVEDADVAPR